MGLIKLEVTHFRNLASLQLEPGPRINLICGANGAGKSSILEAIFVLGLGRSFRTHRTRRLIKDDEGSAILFGETDAGSRLGLAKLASGSTEARINGVSPSSLAELSSHLPLQLFDPESLDLLSGPSLPRRQLLDWGVFHVEPDFLSSWLRARRAMQQRNSLLKSGRMSDEEFSVWEAELAFSAASLSVFRSSLIEAWLPALSNCLTELLPDAGLLVEYFPGWDINKNYQQLLAENRLKDKERGFTFHGPHRADLKIRSHGIPVEERLSRGQLKLLACAIKLSLSDWLSKTRGLNPVLLFDDLASELDSVSRLKIGGWVEKMPVQAFFTCIEKSQLSGIWPDKFVRVFHVEQGCVIHESI